MLGVIKMWRKQHKHTSGMFSTLTEKFKPSISMQSRNSLNFYANTNKELAVGCKTSFGDGFPLSLSLMSNGSNK
jgi:hypothetical protein